MPSMKTLLKSMAIALAAVAVASRVEAIGDIVFDRV